MALQVAGGFKERPLPDVVREVFHKKLDELLDMYEAGHPLWIHGSSTVVMNRAQDVSCDIYLKEYV